MKKLAKNIIVTIFGWQVRRLRKKAGIKIIAIAGSIGKTSTKYAVATVLEQSYKVQWQRGNYNDLTSVPLVFFGLNMPNIFNPLSWLILFLKIELQLTKTYPYDVVVVEIGTDYPGNLIQFKRFLHADIGVLTAITPEHMEFFKDLDDVAKEELAVAQMSDMLLVNLDYCSEKYIAPISNYLAYGEHAKADYRLGNIKFSVDGCNFDVLKNNQEFLREHHDSFAKNQLVSINAAIAVADLMNMDKQSIRKGIGAIVAVSGRMQKIRGINGSVILDDTYNASPDATKAALDTLYKIEAPQKIALLGNMNELGGYSKAAHTAIGEYCSAKQLDLVITLGSDANEYLALAAEKNGCKVIRTNTPYESAEEIKDVIKPGAVILAKGSQNMVYAEEAVKALLEDPKDSDKLVRQTPEWLKKKQRAFLAKV